jgi:site-specific DNA-cytosine methylase
MRLLELFSGTGSIGKTFAQMGWEVVSLDSDVKTDATIKEDILTWDHTVYPPGHFDAIWASPCCTQYSCARRGAKTPRNLPLADALVIRSQELINYFNPRVWFIENPQTGMLKNRLFMINIPFCDVDYCCYCNWGYKKRTRLWNNVNFKGRL